MNRFTYSILASFVITLLFGWMYANQTMYVTEVYYYDQMMREERPIDSRIVVIGVDDASLENVGQWPWSRAIHADMIDRIANAGAKAIGVDFLFAEKSQDPTEDEAMQAVIQKHPNVIIPSAFVFPEKQEDEHQLVYKGLLQPVYTLADEQHSHINVMAHRGEVVRQVPLGVPDSQGKMVPAFSLRLANLFLPSEKQIHYENGLWKQGSTILPANERNLLYFSFAQPPGAFSTLSYFDILSMDEEAMKGLFKDSIVLIGPYSIGLGDQYLTPMSAATKMYGIEIHANIIQAIEDSRFYEVIEDKKAWIGWLMIWALSFITLELTRRFRALWAFSSFLFFFLAYSAATIYFSFYHSVILPYTYPILALITAYIGAIVAKYVSEWREKNRITMLFGRYVSKQVANEILHSEAAQSLGGSRRNVTVMFVDIRGFTPLSERIEPEEVIQVLNEYLDLCTQAVFRYEGTLDKFIGDGVMSIFGAPNTLFNHPEMAVRAALEMKQGSAALADKLTQKYGYSVAFGIGINTGDAVIGNIGSHNRLDYTAIGDSVNMAARLESNAKPGQILISQSTYMMVKELFEIEPLGEIKVKGKEKPVQVYQVLSEKSG